MTQAPQRPDVVDVLTNDHHEVLDLLEQAKASDDAGERRELADVAISELVRHSVAEEMFVYPVMREQLPDGDEAVASDVSEHKELETIMKKLEGADPQHAEFDDLLLQLEAALRGHVRDEEGLQFPYLRAQIAHSELVELAEKVELAKRVAPTRPHPLAPNNQLFHKVVGPGVGMVDRIRDALSDRRTS